jgi:hypothetical protein
MACGVYTVTKVPDAHVGEVIGDFNLDNPVSVTKTKQADGTWTVVATFLPCPPDQPQTTTSAYSG